MRHFLRLTSPEMPLVFKVSGHGKAPEEEKQLGTFVPVANEVECIRKAASPPIFSVPAEAALRKPGITGVGREHFQWSRQKPST